MLQFQENGIVLNSKTILFTLPLKMMLSTTFTIMLSYLLDIPLARSAVDRPHVFMFDEIACFLLS